MPQTMVVIYQHKQEAFFGKLLKDYIERNSIPDVFFYEVKNSCDRLSVKGTKRSLKEIYEAMLRSKPNLTINVHLGESMNNVYRAEIYTYTEHEKLKVLDHPVNGSYLIGKGSIIVPKINPEEFLFPTIFTQPEYPYIVLEMVLDFEDNKPLFQREMEFAASLVRQIIELYTTKIVA